MKWIKSDLVQNMFGLWLGYLLFLVLMHKLQPDDRWTAIMSRPVSLVLVPLVVACIPVLFTMSKRVTREDYGEDDGGESLPSAISPSRSDIVRRMVLVWLTSLVVFASPLGIYADVLNPVFHNAVFLLVAPLLLACIPLLFPSLAFKRTSVPEAEAPLSRSRIWRGIVACVLFVMFAIGVLLLINDSSLTRHDGSSLWPNIFFTVGLIAALWRGLYFVKLLRSSR